MFNKDKPAKPPRVKWQATFEFTALRRLAVLNGQVYKAGILPPREGELPPPVGPLAGAQAQVTDPMRRHRIGKSVGMAVSGLGPLALAGALTKDTKAMLVVAFADGQAITQQLTNRKEIAQAQATAVRFNTMAAAADTQ